MLPNRAEWPLAWLGFARVGAVMVPVNTAYRSADAGFVLRHAGVRAVVTMRALAPLLLDVRADIGAAFGILCVDGDADGEVMAYVVPGDGVSREEVSPSVLSAFCAKRLARFKVPRYWKYRDDLPRTPSERIRKEALREEHDDPTAEAWDRVENRWR